MRVLLWRYNLCSLSCVLFYHHRLLSHVHVLLEVGGASALVMFIYVFYTVRTQMSRSICNFTHKSNTQNKHTHYSSQFLFYFGYLVIAGTIADWYFTRIGPNGHKVVGDAEDEISRTYVVQRHVTLIRAVLLLFLLLPRADTKVVGEAEDEISRTYVVQTVAMWRQFLLHLSARTNFTIIVQCNTTRTQLSFYVIGQCNIT
jgi:hypothetical protein